MWQRIKFATHRDGSRRSELRRLLSLAAWAQRHAAATESLAISARVPPDCQPAALKAVSQAALAAAGALQALSLTTNRGFWCGAWLPRLQQLRSLHLCSMVGGLSLHGDLSLLSQLTSLFLEAKHAVALQEHVRLPHSIQSVELSCIRDTLPPPLGQLTRLHSLAVRRGLVSEGILLTEYECLAHLTELTSLSLEHQEEEAWLPPPELLQLTRLRHLSISGNDCSRWPLHGSDEAFCLMVSRMAQLTSLDISGCGLEQLPHAILAPDSHADDGSVAEEGEEGGQRSVGCRPRLRRLLAHGNQLEAFEADEEGQEDALLNFPRSVHQLSIDWQLLEHLRAQAAATAAAPRQPPSLWLPPHCHQLALVGREGIDSGPLAALPALLPELRHVLLDPHAQEVLRRQGLGTSSATDLLPSPEAAPGTVPAGNGDWQLVGGRWRPTRLPGKRRQQPAQDVHRLLRQAGVEVVELREPSQLPALLDQLAEQQAT